MFCYISVFGLCVTLCSLFSSLFFPLSLLQFLLSDCFCSVLFPLLHSGPTFGFDLLLLLIFYQSTFLLLSSQIPFFFFPHLLPPFRIVRLRAHGGVRPAPSSLAQCSLLPASICRSSGPHRPAQRAGWGPGKRQSLSEPAQDWISGYKHTNITQKACTHLWNRTMCWSEVISIIPV